MNTTGLMRPDEVSDQIPELTVPDEASYETVGGFIMAQLGRIAVVGDTVPVDGGTLEVERLDGRRVDRVRFIPGSATGAVLPEAGNAGGAR